MADVLTALGVKVNHQGNTLDVDATSISHSRAPYEIVSKLRASFFVIGPLLARLGVARIPLPGGCAIGARPVALHIRGLQALGAEVHMDHGIVHLFTKRYNDSPTDRVIIASWNPKVSILTLYTPTG